MATLAAKIRAHIDQGKTNAVISEELKCRPEYVRATRSRYANPDMHRAYAAELRKCPEQRRYQREYKRFRYATDPEYRAKQKAYHKR